MTDNWWKDGKQDREIEENRVAIANVQSSAAAQVSMATASMHLRLSDLEVKVAVLMQMLAEAGQLDPRVLELRVEAHLDELRQRSTAPDFPCVNCGKESGAGAGQTPFGPVCASCGGAPQAPTGEGPYR